MGDLSATVYAAGLHRIDGPADNNCPFFVKQIRRGCFALAFYADKCVATFVGRPPLINHRYCSLDAPLDLSDDVLFSRDDVLERGLAELDENGWDRHGRRHRVSPVRIRYILSVFREEVLEIALGDGYQGDLQEKARYVPVHDIATPKSYPNKMQPYSSQGSSSMGRMPRLFSIRPTGARSTGAALSRLGRVYAVSPLHGLLALDIFAAPGSGQERQRWPSSVV